MKELADPRTGLYHTIKIYKSSCRYSTVLCALLLEYSHSTGYTLLIHTLGTLFLLIHTVGITNSS
jgi:hypothetical protein